MSPSSPAEKIGRYGAALFLFCLYDRWTMVSQHYIVHHPFQLIQPPAYTNITISV